ncbi:MAG: hypothetical protein AB7Q01_02695 [Gammaproteobacteria bacterium]
MRSYTPEQYAAAEAAGLRTSNGMLYTTSVAGKKTAGITLFKELHHTSRDTQVAKRDLIGKFRLAEIETLAPGKSCIK